MQAVFSLMEWLGEMALSSGYSGWMWWTLNGPPESQTERTKQTWVGDVLRHLLRQEGDWVERLSMHLERALQISRDEVLSLLWEPPRSLMLEVIPTLARRLATDWELTGSTGTTQTTDLKAPAGQVHPLPDYVPPNLFSELSLPEVTIVLPPATARHQERAESLSIVQALNRFAPGCVTRRFAFEHGGLNHWLPVPLDSPRYELPVSRFAEQHECVAHVPVRIGGEIKRVPCFRPWVIRPEKVSNDLVSPTSSARLSWSSELVPTDAPVAFAISQISDWGQFVRSVDFYLHAFRAAVTVRRFAAEANASIHRPRVDDELRVQTQFVTDDGEPASVGFEQDVDGMCVQIRFPDADTLVERASSSKVSRTWRTMYFRDLVLTDPVLLSETNWFQREWLQQIYLSALVTEACLHNVTLPEARDRLEKQTANEAFGPVIETIFRIREGNDEETADSTAPAGRLEERLRDLLSRPAILRRLHELSISLWAPDPAAWGRWLWARVHETLGEAVLAASLAIAPRHAAIETLLLDLNRGVADGVSADDQAELWVTESTPGGTGVIESIAEAFAADQRRFFTALEAALAPSDLEAASTNLDVFARLLTEDAAVAAATEGIRRCHGHRPRQDARMALFRVLAQRGLAVHHAFSVALEHRLLRDGMDRGADQLIEALIARWQECESRLGVAISLRVFCYVAVVDPDFGPRLQSWLRSMSGVALSAAEMTGVLAGILWPRPAEVRGRSLESYSPFREQGRTDPSLIRDLLLSTEEEAVKYGTDSWRERVIATLTETGKVRLTAAREHEAALHRELLSLFATPVDVDYLQFYPVVEQAGGDGSEISVGLILREVAAA